jgi:hypothetical protein
MFGSRKDSGSEMITVSELKGNNLNDFCLLFTLHEASNGNSKPPVFYRITYVSLE